MRKAKGECCMLQGEEGYEQANRSENRDGGKGSREATCFSLHECKFCLG